MGLNTAAIILNDAIDRIRDDPDFNKRLYDAILTADREGYADVSALGHCNAATVLPSVHADMTQLITVGGNSINRLGVFGGWQHSDLDTQIRIIKEFADSLGYRLVKKPKR